jgi:hypothetical protein
LEVFCKLNRFFRMPEVKVMEVEDAMVFSPFLGILGLLA